MINKRVPEAVIRRLPKYYSKLSELEVQGVIRISSLQLSQQMGLNASLIRQDLNFFGGFGQQGYGYMVENLRENIGEILGLYNERTMVLVGCGNLGAAIVNYNRFSQIGFSIKKIFEADENMVGKTINDIEVLHIDLLPEFLQNHKTDIGIITVPASVAQKVANTFMENGVKGIWNFTPADIKAKNTVIENVRLSESLFSLNYKILNEIYD